jgi:hypothetical protein
MRELICDMLLLNLSSRMLIQYRKIVFDRKTNEAEIRNFLYSLSSCRSLELEKY